MKNYRLTLIKDLPEAKSGYSKIFNEGELEGRFSSNDWTDADYALRKYRNNTEFVKKEIDLANAIPMLVCPKCGNVSLIRCDGKRDYESTEEGHFYSKPVTLECGLCDNVIDLGKVYIAPYL